MLVIELDSSRARLTRSSGLILLKRRFRRDGDALYSTPVSRSPPLAHKNEMVLNKNCEKGDDQRASLASRRRRCFEKDSLDT